MGCGIESARRSGAAVTSAAQLPPECRLECRRFETGILATVVPGRWDYGERPGGRYGGREKQPDASSEFHGGVQGSRLAVTGGTGGVL